MPRERIGSTESSEKIDYLNASFVVPGQASQKVGMGEGLFKQSKAAREVFGRVDDALKFKLSELMFHGPEDKLRDTVNAQPAILTLAVATFEALKEQLGNDMIKPKVVAGHSAGEYPILVITGVLDLENGAQLVRTRGELMQEASLKTPGTMAAIIGLNKSHLEYICEETGVELANINTDDQMVISGRKIQIANALDFAYTFASRQGIQIKRVPLPVSGAFHSSLMESAKQGLQNTISSFDFQDPITPILANSYPRPLTTKYDVQDELVEGLCLPVNWRDTVRLMANKGITTVIELGPKVLSGMVNRIDPNLRTFTIDSFESAINFASLLSQQPANRNNPLTA